MRCVALWMICLFAGVLAAQAEMDVQRGGVSIPVGDTDSVNSPGTSPFNLNYTILNTGTADLNLTSMPEVVISGEDNCTVTLLAAPGTPVAAAGSTVFTLQVAPTSTADFGFDVSIPNDDADENPYDFHFGATHSSGTTSSSGGGNSSGCSTDETSGTWWLLVTAVAAGAILLKTAWCRASVD